MLFDREAYRDADRPPSIPAPYRNPHARYQCAWCRRRVTHVVVARPAQPGRAELLVCQPCYQHPERRDWPPTDQEEEGRAP